MRLILRRALYLRLKSGGSAQDDLVNTDYVIAIQQVDRTNGNLMVLFKRRPERSKWRISIRRNSAWKRCPPVSAPTTGFTPPDSDVLFGVSPTGPLRMPFNRSGWPYRERPPPACRQDVRREQEFYTRRLLIALTANIEKCP